MIVSRAPIRLSMGGGGTDLPSYYEKHGGFLMAVTINKYVYIMANKRFHQSIRVSYSETEIVDDVNMIQHDIFREALRYTGINRQVELVSVADVPAQCGMGTSSTFTVALLNALFAYKKQYVTLDELARIACYIELDLLKKPIGKQDQYAASFGGFKAYWFHPDGNVLVEPVDIKEEILMELQNSLFLFNIGRERSADSILHVQNEESKKGNTETLERLHKIKEIGLRTLEILRNGKLDEFGEALHEHWTIKKGLSDGITGPHIEEIYEHARKNGAIGGKIVGAGGGGFLMLYCPRNRPKMVSAMREVGLEPMWFSFEQEGAKIVFYG